MTSDLLSRLREPPASIDSARAIMAEAAAEIERLREVKGRALRIADERALEAVALRIRLAEVQH